MTIANYRSPLGRNKPGDRCLPVKKSPPRSFVFFRPFRARFPPLPPSFYYFLSYFPWQANSCLPTMRHIYQEIITKVVVCCFDNRGNVAVCIAASVPLVQWLSPNHPSNSPPWPFDVAIMMHNLELSPCPSRPTSFFSPSKPFNLKCVPRRAVFVGYFN